MMISRATALDGMLRKKTMGEFLLMGVLALVGYSIFHSAGASASPSGTAAAASTLTQPSTLTLSPSVEPGDGPTIASAGAGVQIPSDSDLANYFGLSNTAHRINQLALACLSTMRIQYNTPTFTPSAACQKGTSNAPNLNVAAMVAPASSVAGAGIGVAASVGAISASAATIVGAGIAAGIAIFDVFDSIFSHHAAAVNKEQDVICAASAGANQVLDAIDSALQQGTLTPMSVPQAHSQLISNFTQAVASVAQGCG